MGEAQARLDEAKAAAFDMFLKTQAKERPATVRRLSDSAALDVDVIPTGVIGLDAAIGAGGFPRGRIVELFGPESGGKTTLALEVAKRCQDMGGIVGFVDAEHALNIDLVRNIGIDESRFVVAQPDTGEEAIEIVRSMLESTAFDMVIVDSVAAMVPKAMVEADAEQAFMGLHARLISRFMRVIAPLAGRTGTLVCLINQVRSDLQAYGAPEKATGGRAIAFFATLRIEVRTSPSKRIEQGGQAVGTQVKATVKKNKVGAPFRYTEYDIIFGQGIDGAGSLLDAADRTGVIEKAGNTWYVRYLGAELTPVEEKIGVGKPKAKERLTADPDLAAQVEAAVRARLTGAPLPAAPTAEAA
ncbi:recombinase RecA [Bailinhaonella thermotolerans]|uniref:recombinase RecA n=1 Tax=Bailinhaonella thermotolerans TaxID=1070861 RepID=UPI00192A4BF9|nr:DNA recombination/repair protein RecA [Bailinhaonella thermotolerans]